VSASTNRFGLITPEGRFIRFDDPSNSRVIQIMKSNTTLNRHLSENSPLQVRIVGSANGDVAVVQSLDAQEAAAIDPSGANGDVIFDVRYHNDRGKLVVTSRGVNFEDLSDSKHSRSWSYAQIKELKRQGGNEIKIEPHQGDSIEFKVEGPEMSEAVYQAIANRVAAARSR